MKLNAEQIKKALECCKTPLASDCENCSYTGKRLEDGVYEGCVNCLVGDALALITSLEQRIEELSEENENLHATCTEFERKCASLNDENEILNSEKEAKNKELFQKWKKLADETADRYEGLYQDAKKALVADTVRKMRSEIKERCIMGGIYPAFVASTIEQIAKEIIGEVK